MAHGRGRGLGRGRGGRACHQRCCGHRPAPPRRDLSARTGRTPCGPSRDAGDGPPPRRSLGAARVPGGARGRDGAAAHGGAGASPPPQVCQCRRGAEGGGPGGWAQPGSEGCGRRGGARSGPARVSLPGGRGDRPPAQAPGAAEAALPCGCEGTRRRAAPGPGARPGGGEPPPGVRGNGGALPGRVLAAPLWLRPPWHPRLLGPVVAAKVTRTPAWHGVVGWPWEDVSLHYG